MVILTEGTFSTSGPPSSCRRPRLLLHFEDSSIFLKGIKNYDIQPAFHIHRFHIHGFYIHRYSQPRIENGIFNSQMQRDNYMHYSMPFCMRLEDPWILVFMGGPRTLRISRNNSIFNCLHYFKIAFLALRQNYTITYNAWWDPEICILNKCFMPSDAWQHLKSMPWILPWEERTPSEVDFLVMPGKLIPSPQFGMCMPQRFVLFSHHKETAIPYEVREGPNEVSSY